MTHLAAPHRKTFPVREFLWYYKSVKGWGQYNAWGKWLKGEKAKRLKPFRLASDKPMPFLFPPVPQIMMREFQTLKGLA
jgi:hypothetical protein